MEFLEWLASEGGVCTVQAARTVVSKEDLQAMTGTQIWSPLRGWVALVGLQNDVTRALGAGGVATCVTAFAQHELWLPHGPQKLHVRIRRNTHSVRASGTRTKDSIVAHATPSRLDESRPQFGIDAPIVALANAAHCIGESELMAAADTALAKELVSPEDLAELVKLLPLRRTRGLAWATGTAGSGSESEFAALLRRCRIAYRQQASPVEGEFVDFLIGRSLVVEIDSVAWHASPEQLANDRRRDAELTRRGYVVVRFTYEQVLFQPDYVREVVLDLVRRGVHRRAPWS